MVEVREEKRQYQPARRGRNFHGYGGVAQPRQFEHVDKFVHEEIEKLAQYIVNTKQEIFAIQTNEKSEDVITDASVHISMK